MLLEELIQDSHIHKHIPSSKLDMARRELIKEGWRFIHVNVKLVKNDIVLSVI